MKKLNWLFGSVIDTVISFCIFVSVVMMIVLIFKGVLPNLIRIFKKKSIDESDENSEKKKNTQYVISAAVSTAALIIPIVILVLAIEMKKA